MPKISDMIQSKYLKGADVPSPIIVTITGFKKDNVAKEDDEPQFKWMIKFAEFERMMVLNVTNIKIAEKVFGSDNTDDWIGKEIVLYFDENVSFGGELVGGLRFRRPDVAPVRKPVQGVTAQDIKNTFSGTPALKPAIVAILKKKFEGWTNLDIISYVGSLGFNMPNNPETGDVFFGRLLEEEANTIINMLDKQ